MIFTEYLLDVLKIALPVAVSFWCVWILRFPEDSTESPRGHYT